MKKIMLVSGTRPEAIEVRRVKLVGTNTSIIVKETSNLIKTLDMNLKMSSSINLHGDNFVSKYIIDITKMNEL